MPLHREQRTSYSREDLHALNLVDQPIWVFDIVRRAMWYANDAAVELWSAKSLDELLKRDFSTDMSEATKHRLDDCLFKFSSDENCVVKEQWTFYPNQQGPKTVDTRCKGIPIEEGRLAMLLHGTIKETTSETEQQALRSVEMLRHLPVAVCLMDIDGNVKEQNPEALSVFGSIDKKNTTTTTTKSDDKEDEEEEGGNSSEDTAFVKRFVDKELGERILQEARTGKEVHRLEALQNTVLGPRWSAIQVRQTKDPVTSDPILLYSSRDITAVVEAKRQAVAADAAKMDLLADMAHAIRTPLQHVVGVVELMSREQATGDHTPEQDSRYSNLLQSSAQLLMTVLHDMMHSVNNPDDYGIRPTSATGPTTIDPPHLPPSNRIKLEHAQIDVRHVVDSTIATITPHAQVKDLSVKAQVTSHLNNVSVMGDANRLGQVLFEILHNAVKYTSRGGIAITVRRLSKKRARRVRLRFEVKDSGVGLNLEQQQNCLKTRASRRENNNRQSSEGVGLELCKSLVEAMGGTIGVQSKPGRGTTFWFEIPFLRAAVVTTSKACGGSLPSSSGGPSSGKRLRRCRSSSSLDPVLDGCGDEEEGGLQILLVDENNVGRNVMTALLEQSGHSVTTAADGAAMVEAVSQESFDVVLVETQLPSAFEATREVRTMGHSPESLPILALTAAVPRADYPELGFNDWLTKPMLIKDIQKAMTNAICNVGTKSTGTGSIFSAEDTYGLDCTSIGHSARSCGSLNGRSKTGPSMPRRGSFNSIQSAFSDHLQAVLGTHNDFLKEEEEEEEEEEVATNKVIAVANKSSIARIPSSCSRSSGSQKSDKPPKMIRRSSLLKQ